MAGISVVMTPLLVEGVRVGVQARDGNSGALMATAKQVAFDQEDESLVVEEIHYSSVGAVTYRGKLFFDFGGHLLKEQPIEGHKQWSIFRRWSL